MHQTKGFVDSFTSEQVEHVSKKLDVDQKGGGKAMESNLQFRFESQYPATNTFSLVKNKQVSTSLYHHCILFKGFFHNALLRSQFHGSLVERLIFPEFFL